MPTKHDHLRSEIADILASVAGLNVVTSMVSGQEPERPFTFIRVGGWEKKRDGASEGVTVKVSAIVILLVRIRHEGGEEGLEAERNRLDNLLENAVDKYQIPDYVDAQYSCDGYQLEYEGASGVLDQKENDGSFLATLSVSYFQTPIL